MSIKKEQSDDDEHSPSVRYLAGRRCGPAGLPETAPFPQERLAARRVLKKAENRLLTSPCENPRKVGDCGQALHYCRASESFVSRQCKDLLSACITVTAPKASACSRARFSAGVFTQTREQVDAFGAVTAMQVDKQSVHCRETKLSEARQ